MSGAGQVDEKQARGRRLSTTARHRDLHDRLLSAAEAAIAAAGLANLRARSLAEAAGCSVGAIYGVFADLDALTLAVNGRTLDAIEAAMRSAGPQSDPTGHLLRMADAYLDYAAQNRNRWRALFEHRMPAGQAIPGWYADRQALTFSHIEAPVGVLQPRLKDRQRMLLARTLFSAVHGMVDLGLDEKVADMPLPILRAEIRTIVRAIAAGLAQDVGADQQTS